MPGEEASGGASLGFTDFVTGLEGIFGTDVNQDSTTNINSLITRSQAGETRDSLEISDEAIDKIISDILSGPEGLAAIFAGEQNAGVFNTSVAAQAAGDLTAKIAGEIAKLRAVKVRKTQLDETQETESKQVVDANTEKEGLIKRIFGGF